MSQIINETNCPFILLRGRNKGQQCRYHCEGYAGFFCKRHWNYIQGRPEYTEQVMAQKERSAQLLPIVTEVRDRYRTHEDLMKAFGKISTIKNDNYKSTEIKLKIQEKQTELDKLNENVIENTIELTEILMPKLLEKTIVKTIIKDAYDIAKCLLDDEIAELRSRL